MLERIRENPLEYLQKVLEMAKNDQRDAVSFFNLYYDAFQNIFPGLGLDYNYFYGKQLELLTYRRHQFFSEPAFRKSGSCPYKEKIGYLGYFDENEFFFKQGSGTPLVMSFLGEVVEDLRLNKLAENRYKDLVGYNSDGIIFLKLSPQQFFIKEEKK